MLTPKQEKFARCIALEGMNYSDAYRNSYSTKRMSDKVINDEASKLKDHPDVALRIAELKAEIYTPLIMTASERAEKLTNIAFNSPDPNVAMKAIDLLNKMTGEYVQKVQAEMTNAVSINIELSDD